MMTSVLPLISRPMHITYALIMTGTLLVGCQHDDGSKVLSSELVHSRLNEAYVLEDRGDIPGADSIYGMLLSSEVSRKDSAIISGSYISVLFKKGDINGVLSHVDKAFPATSGPWDLVRRSSFRMQAFMLRSKCDSVQIELDQLFELVRRDSTLQLSMGDLLLNQTFVDSICGSNTVVVL